MDQSPIAYEFLSAKTYSFNGEKTIWTKDSRSGWDKRQIMIHADSIRRSKPLFIFRANMTTIARQERPNYNDITKEW